MRRITRSIAACTILGLGLAVAGSASAQGRTTVIVEEEVTMIYPTAELGVQAGVPTGLSGKFWLSPFHAIQGGLTWRFPDEGYSLNADYVAHSYVLHARGQEPSGVRMPLYAGAGIKALRLSSDDPLWGARFPLGVTALLDALPLSVFAEVAPGAVFEREGPEFSADAGVGARVYF